MKCAVSSQLDQLPVFTTLHQLPQALMCHCKSQATMGCMMLLKDMRFCCAQGTICA